MYSDLEVENPLCKKIIMFVFQDVNEFWNKDLFYENLNYFENSVILMYDTFCR